MFGCTLVLISKLSDTASVFVAIPWRWYGSMVSEKFQMDWGRDWLIWASESRNTDTAFGGNDRL